MTTIIEEIESILVKSDKREEGYSALAGLKVAALKQLCSKFDVYISKPNKQSLQESLVEATIGSRLRSEAIRKTKLT
jgi:S-ribosylhomocysteine lyase LuxS involved in autoinducer biosynthesis